jgi:hypothetical protein
MCLGADNPDPSDAAESYEALISTKVAKCFFSGRIVPAIGRRYVGLVPRSVHRVAKTM